MPDLVATTPGLYPLPDWAKEELADLKGHQRHDLISGDEGDDIVDAYDRARAEVITIQEEAGLDRIVEGQLRWDDMLAHPLAVHDNVETRGLLRYYDNNNFYREPVVVGDLDFDGDLAADLETAAELVPTETLQGVVPGPYSMFDLATDDYYGDDAEFLAAIADFLAAEIDAFPSIETLFVLEPSLVTTPPDDDLVDRVDDAVSTVARATDATVVAHTYWGVPTDAVHDRLVDGSVDAIGYDLTTAPDDALELIAEHGTTEDVALGLVDGQNTRIESPQAIIEDVTRVRDQIDGDFETIYLTTNTEPFYLPVNKFEAKLETLADATTLQDHEVNA